MKPDAAFVDFFSGDYRSPSRWDRLLEAVEIPGLAGASWDRKAAYLLWLATDGGRDMPSPSVSEMTPDTTDKPKQASIFE